MKKTEDRPQRKEKLKPWELDGKKKTLRDARTHLNSKNKHRRFVYN